MPRFAGAHVSMSVHKCLCERTQTVTVKVRADNCGPRAERHFNNAFYTSWANDIIFKTLYMYPYKEFHLSREAVIAGLLSSTQIIREKFVFLLGINTSYSLLCGNLVKNI